MFEKFGLDAHVDLKRRFDQWERDLSFFEVRPTPSPTTNKGNDYE